MGTGAVELVGCTILLSLFSYISTSVELQPLLHSSYMYLLLYVPYRYHRHYHHHRPWGVVLVHRRGRQNQKQFKLRYLIYLYVYYFRELVRTYYTMPPVREGGRVKNGSGWGMVFVLLLLFSPSP